MTTPSLPGPGALHPHALSGARIVLGVSGSIAAYKAAELARALGRAGAEVQVVMTPAATRFIPALTLSVLTGREALVEVFPSDDRGEAEPGAAIGAWTKHVELGLWADAVVIAPATAQTLASLAHGFCDSLLAAVVLSARCPVMVAPAMDHDMWCHPATQRNVETLRRDGVEVVEPASGALASGLVGQGRLPEPDDLVGEIGRWLGRARAQEDGRLASKTVLVTAGPTREALDPVRFLSNGSTGTMGFEIAAAAARRGATVTLLAGPVSLATPRGVTRVDVVTAQDLLAAALDHADADVVIAAAAVSDYAPAEPSDRKVAKTDDDLVIRLRRTPDVLAALGERKRAGQMLVGFALETHDGEAHARAKLARKRLDWIALNDAAASGEGFGTGTNRLTLLSADGRRVDIPTASKRAVAEALLDAVTAPAETALSVA